MGRRVIDLPGDCGSPARFTGGDFCGRPISPERLTQQSLMDRLLLLGESLTRRQRCRDQAEAAFYGEVIFMNRLWAIL